MHVMSEKTPTSRPAPVCLLPPAADKQSHTTSAALCQEETYAVQQIAALFDHLVGAGKHGRRHVEAERLGRLEVEHRLVLGRRLHWQVGRLLALQDAIDVAGRAPVLVGVICTIGG